MKHHSMLSRISILLVISIFLCLLPISASAEEGKPLSGMESLLAGIATVEDVYGTLDPETVPDAVGYETAVARTHVQRLYDEEGNDLNRVVFRNADGSRTAYLFDYPVK